MIAVAVLLLASPAAPLARPRTEGQCLTQIGMFGKVANYPKVQFRGEKVAFYLGVRQNYTFLWPHPKGGARLDRMAGHWRLRGAPQSAVRACNCSG